MFCSSNREILLYYTVSAIDHLRKCPDSSFLLSIRAISHIAQGLICYPMNLGDSVCQLFEVDKVKAGVSGMLFIV